jgi:hypothetical protein
MEKKLNIHQRLNAMMSEVAYIKKDKEISLGRGGYTVTGHDAVTKLIHPLLVEHGINIIPTTKLVTQEGNRTRVDMEFKWVNIDKPEEFFITEASGYGIDQQDKGIGKGWSVAQRFTVLKTLHLETGDKDIEDEKIDFKEEAKQEKMVEEFTKEVEAKLSEDEQKELVSLAVKLEVKTSDVIELFHSHDYNKAKDIPQVKFNFFKQEIEELSHKGVAHAG